MTYQTKQFRPNRGERRMRPLFGFAAAAAAVATLGLAVIAPAQVARSGATGPALAAAPVAAVQARPAEVAILPGHIHVVAVRAKSAVRAATLMRTDVGQRS